MNKRWHLIFLLFSLALAACQPQALSTLPTTAPGSLAASAPPAAEETSTPLPTATPTIQPRVEPLALELLYPTEALAVETGQSVRFIVKVDGAQGQPVSAARVSLRVLDLDGQALVEMPAEPYSEGAYRTAAWEVPYRLPTGLWRAEVIAQTGTAAGARMIGFTVKPTRSDEFLAKYGFWLQAPVLGGITTSLFVERGDAQRGMVRWGGYLPSVHVLPSAWVDVQWRAGDFQLDTPEAVRNFLLAEIGNLSFTPVRELGPIEPFQFKSWPGWRVEGRGQITHDLLEWVVFYAPEVDKTFAINTAVVLPPAGADPHARLRESFAVDAEIEARGVAPEPLPDLLPGPELLKPPLAARYTGTEQPVVLSWAPLKELAADEYYEVLVDYNYSENNEKVRLATRETQITLPLELYRAPNCQVFNWQVALYRQTGTTPEGAPRGEALSYPSLYRYVQWFYPPDEAEPFVSICPNPQY